MSEKLWSRHAVYLSWGIGSLGTTAMIAAISFLGLYYLVEVIGLTPAVAGVVIFCGKAIDFVAYPLVGSLSDRTRTRWGRRRPYLLLGSLASGLAFFGFFTLPLSLTVGGRALAAVVALTCYALALVVYFVPYMAQPAELVTDPKARNLIMAYRSAFLMIGTLVGSALTTVLIQHCGGGASGYRGMAVVVGGVITGSMLITFFGTRGREAFKAVTDTVAPRWMPDWRSISQSYDFLILVVVNLLQFFGMAAGSAVIVFFVTLVLKRPVDWLALYGSVIITTALIVMHGWVFVATRWGKRIAYMWALAGYAAVMCSWLAGTANESIGAFIVRAVGVGLFSAGLLMCGQSMVLDAIAADQRRSGIAREATLMSLYALAEKIAGALGPLAVGLLLSGFGFHADANGAGSLGKGPRLALDISLVWMMVAVVVAALCLLRRYPEEHARRSGARPIIEHA